MTLHFFKQVATTPSPEAGETKLAVVLRRSFMSIASKTPELRPKEWFDGLYQDAQIMVSEALSSLVDFRLLPPKQQELVRQDCVQYTYSLGISLIATLENRMVTRSSDLVRMLHNQFFKNTTDLEQKFDAFAKFVTMCDETHPYFTRHNPDLSGIGFIHLTTDQLDVFGRVVCDFFADSKRIVSVGSGRGAVEYRLLERHKDIPPIVGVEITDSGPDRGLGQPLIPSTTQVQNPQEIYFLVPKLFKTPDASATYLKRDHKHGDFMFLYPRPGVVVASLESQPNRVLIVAEGTDLFFSDKDYDAIKKEYTAYVGEFRHAHHRGSALNTILLTRRGGGETAIPKDFFQVKDLKSHYGVYECPAMSDCAQKIESRLTGDMDEAVLVEKLMRGMPPAMRAMFTGKMP